MKVVVDRAIPFLEGVLEPFATVEYYSAECITAAVVADADALIIRTRTRCNRALLEGSKVQFIATATIGFDHIDENGEPQQTQQNGYQQKNNGGYQRQQAQPRQQYNNQRPAQPQVVQPQAQAPALDQTAALKATINSTNDVSALVSLYLDNTQVIEANPELKSLLTNRKKALQSLNAA